MASTPLDATPVIVTMPGSIPSMPAVARILSRYDRSKIEAFIAIAIDLADTFDGDAEVEEVPLEDAFVAHDPIYADENSDGRDSSWAEWHTRGRHKMANGVSETAAPLIHEDREDDDADTGVEDHPEGSTLRKMSVLMIWAATKTPTWSASRWRTMCRCFPSLAPLTICSLISACRWDCRTCRRASGRSANLSSPPTAA